MIAGGVDQAECLNEVGAVAVFEERTQIRHHPGKRGGFPPGQEGDEVAGDSVWGRGIESGDRLVFDKDEVAAGRACVVIDGGVGESALPYMSLIFGVAIREVRAGWPAAATTSCSVREHDGAGFEVGVEKVDESGEVEAALSTEFPSSWTGRESCECVAEFGSVDAAVGVDVRGEFGDGFLIVGDGGFLVVGFAECCDHDGAEF